jgi:hypothetical protein
MPVEKGPIFKERDIYIDYPYVKVMYRWDHVAAKMFIRRYGKAESPVPVPHDDELVNEALLYGEEISKEEYLRGK